MVATDERQGEAAPRNEPEPRWLTDTQQRDWRAYLLGVAVLSDELTRVLEEGFGLSLGDYELLVRLSESPDHELRMSQLAHELVHSRSRVSYAVTTLERRGLVARGAATCDRRGVVCRLTDTGWALLQRAAIVHVASVREYFVDVIGPHRLAAVGEAMALVAAHARPGGATSRTPRSPGDAGD